MLQIIQHAEGCVVSDDVKSLEGCVVFNLASMNINSKLLVQGNVSVSASTAAKAKDAVSVLVFSRAKCICMQQSLVGTNGCLYFPKPNAFACNKASLAQMALSADSCFSFTTSSSCGG